jgi:hypothetical protein
MICWNALNRSFDRRRLQSARDANYVSPISESTCRSARSQNVWDMTRDACPNERVKKMGGLWVIQTGLIASSDRFTCGLARLATRKSSRHGLIRILAYEVARLHASASRITGFNPSTIARTGGRLRRLAATLSHHLARADTPLLNKENQSLKDKTRRHTSRSIFSGSMMRSASSRHSERASSERDLRAKEQRD